MSIIDLKRLLLSVTLNRFCFTPKLLPTLATLLVLPLLISLGFWQLDRADQKDMLKQQGITTACRIKKASTKMTVRQHHGDNPC